MVGLMRHELSTCGQRDLRITLAADARTGHVPIGETSRPTGEARSRRRKMDQPNLGEGGLDEAPVNQAKSATCEGGNLRPSKHRDAPIVEAVSVSSPSNRSNTPSVLRQAVLRRELRSIRHGHAGETISASCLSPGPLETAQKSRQTTLDLRRKQPTFEVIEVDWER
jgi:hypothetical protein